MSTATNKLTSMIKETPEISAALENSIASVQTEITDLTQQKSAVTSICNTTEADARDLLENTILIDKGGDYVAYGSTFGSIQFSPAGNLTDWAIIKLIIPPLPAPPIPVPTPIYTYTPGDYPDLDQWTEDFTFSSDYITRPLTEGATYGLTPNIDTLGAGKDILENNKDKVDDSVAVFSRYAT